MLVMRPQLVLVMKPQLVLVMKPQLATMLAVTGDSCRGHGGMVVLCVYYMCE